MTFSLQYIHHKVILFSCFSHDFSLFLTQKTSFPHHLSINDGSIPALSCPDIGETSHFCRACRMEEGISRDGRIVLYFAKVGAAVRRPCQTVAYRSRTWNGGRYQPRWEKCPIFREGWCSGEEITPGHGVSQRRSQLSGCHRSSCSRYG